MGRAEPKRHNKLNQKQLALLHLIYRFRFVTTDLVARYQGKRSGTTVYPRLATLAEQGYIGRKYDPSYKLRGQHAAYYLLTDGMRALRRQPREGYTYAANVLHNLHKDKEASDQFIEHNLIVLEAYCHLKARYGDQLQFFTKNDLTVYDHFPQPLPDGYLRLKTGEREEVKQFFLDVHQEARPFFIAARRIKQYAEYANSKKWEITETKLPDILTVCGTPTLQKRLHKRMAKEPHPELNFLLTTREGLAKIAHNTSVWWSANKLEGTLSLEEPQS